MIAQHTHTQFEEFSRGLEGIRKAVLCTHINPDGDGLGSQLALRSYLMSRGIEVTILNNDPVPRSYRFLDAEGTVLLAFDASQHASIIQDADLVIVVDTNHPNRLGSLTEHVIAHGGKKAIVDHHLEPDGFADIVIADDGACATGEIVYRFLEHQGALPLTGDIATALYTAIMTDTGSFRFPKTDSSVHRIVADLLDAGADPVSIYQHVYEQGRANRLHLLGRVLASLQRFHDGRICVLTVTREMLSETGTTEADTDMFVTYGLSIEGVQVSLMISELPEIVKLNVRSKGSIPANEIAKAFGGNGHLNAAGARLSSVDLEELIPRVLEATSHHLDKE